MSAGAVDWLAKPYRVSQFFTRDRSHRCRWIVVGPRNEALATANRIRTWGNESDAQKVANERNAAAQEAHHG